MERCAEGDDQRIVVRGDEAPGEEQAGDRREGEMGTPAVARRFHRQRKVATAPVGKGTRKRCSSIAIVTGPSPVARCRIAMWLPSTFRKATASTPSPRLVVATRQAPGRTKRLAWPST